MAEVVLVTSDQVLAVSCSECNGAATAPCLEKDNNGWHRITTFHQARLEKAQEAK